MIVRITANIADTSGTIFSTAMREGVGAGEAPQSRDTPAKVGRK